MRAWHVCVGGFWPHPPEGILSHGSLGRETRYSPHADLDPTVKLFPSHVPNTVAGDYLGLTLDVIDNKLVG